MSNYLKNIFESGGFSSNIAGSFPYLYALSFSYYLGCNKEKLDLVLSFYVKFITFCSALAILDLLMISLGIYSVRSAYGLPEQYAVGIFSFYHIVLDDSIYPRLYGIFGEPGHYAMYLMPVLAHNWLVKKYFWLAINSTCMVATFSLGGFIGVVFGFFLLYLFATIRTGKLKNLIVLLLVFILVLLTLDFFTDSYLQKAGSASLRENIVSSFFINFVNMVNQYPLGYPFFESSEQMTRDADYFVGTNFTLFNMYMQGGILALFGYLALIFSALYYTVINCRKKVVGIQIFCITIPVFMLFIYQRTTPFDTYYFSFLIAPYLVYFARRLSND
ncbi:hypothetical protein OAT92_06605 [Porticoccaceae bacterium]|nr:hypothetical protein [Porticoccaceae bacterium]